MKKNNLCNRMVFASHAFELLISDATIKTLNEEGHA